MDSHQKDQLLKIVNKEIEAEEDRSSYTGLVARLNELADLRLSLYEVFMGDIKQPKEACGDCACFQSGECHKNAPNPQMFDFDKIRINTLVVCWPKVDNKYGWCEEFQRRT